MIALFTLVLSCLVFCGLVFAGLPAFSTWQACARDGLSLMFVFTGISHFTLMKEDFVRMIPPWIPWARATVCFTGACQVAGGVGLASRPPPRSGLRVDHFLRGRLTRQHSRGTRWHNSSRQTCN